MNRHYRRLQAANIDPKIKKAAETEARASAEKASTPQLFARVSVGARVLDMSRSSVYELIRQGVLPATKIAGKLRIPLAALQRLAEEALEAHADPTRGGYE